MLRLIISDVKENGYVLVSQRELYYHQLSLHDIFIDHGIQSLVFKYGDLDTVIFARDPVVLATKLLEFVSEDSNERICDGSNSK